MAEHWCKEHKQPFFKKGKMKGFAHPILDDDGEPTGVWCNEKEEAEQETKAPGRAYGKSDKELLQVKQLEEAKRRSIEAQVSIKLAVDLFVANKITMADQQDLKPITLVARIFYQLLQALTRISEAEVIHREIKSATVVTPEAGQEPREEIRTDDKGKREATNIREKIEELYRQQGWWIDGKKWTSPEVISHIKGITGRLDINQASDDKLIEIESDLIVRCQAIEKLMEERENVNKDNIK